MAQLRGDREREMCLASRLCARDGQVREVSGPYFLDLDGVDYRRRTGNGLYS